MDIFCPNDHLMLAKRICPICGWQRPEAGQVGKLYWHPLELKTILGGASREGFAQFTRYKDDFLLPTKNNELLSISIMKGSINWRIALPKGQRATDVTLLDDKLFVTFQDTHSLIEGIKGGNICQVDEVNKELIPVWSTQSHDLTPPLSIGDRVFIRTAESKVYCYENITQDEAIWEYECQSWWPSPLSCFADQVVFIDGNPMLDETEIIALNPATGEVNWSYTTPSRPTFQLVGDDNFIVAIVKSKTMFILDASTGKKLFEQALPKYYCKPIFSGETLYYTARGSETDPNGYYQLHSFSPKELKLHYQAKLDNRVRITPLVVEDVIYLADDEGSIQFISAGNGKKISQISGEKEDPIRTNLHCFDNQLVFGTYTGKVFSITIREPKPENQDPIELINEGKFVEAASIYALEGDWVHAAELYANQIANIDKALQLYEKGDLIEKAAQLSFENNLYSRALDYFRAIHDTNGEAKTLLAMGDPESASKLLYSLGDKSQAAELMEQAGKLSIAARLYKESGRMVDYLRLIIKTSLDPSEVEALRKDGKFETAAEWQLENGSFIGAAKDYKEAGLYEKELEAFRKYLSVSVAEPEPWMWQRIAELGRCFSDYMMEAKAWAKLDRPTESGNAYQKYAEQIAGNIPEQGEGVSSPLHQEAAAYYRLAADSFREAGISDREEQCKEMVRKHQFLPKVIILEVKTATGLREMEWNNLSLTIKNIGYGRAREVKFRLNEDYFMVESADSEINFNLAPDRTKVQSIHIKPLRDEIGDFVPLQIDWSWKDSTGKEYSARFNNSVAVAKQREELPSQPIYFNVQNIEGDYVTQKGDRVDIIHGNSPIDGFGMNISRDGVSTKRAGAPNASSGGAKNPLKKCAECNREIPKIARVCPYCRKEQ